MAQPKNVLVGSEDVIMRQLPKNIRQVGEVEGGYRIYMEDYVHTFIKKIQDLAGNRGSAGILLGKAETIGTESCIFINGAILVDELQEKNGEFQFTASVWKKIYEEIRNHFPQLTMQGWFVTGKEEMQIDMVALERVHRNAFSQEESILYFHHGEEYKIWKNRGSDFTKLQGFYIYYERNEEMQAYMIGIGQSSPSEHVTKDETVENFRAIMEQKRTEHNMMIPVIRGIGMVSIAMILFLTISAWREHGTFWVNGNTDLIETLIETSEPIIQAGAEVEGTENDVGMTTLADNLTEEQHTEEIIESEPKESQSEENLEESVSQEDVTSSKEDTEVGILVNYYEIKKGDTLVSISMSFYGTLSMVDEICRINHIENPNAIYTGQKIRLP